MADQSGKHFKQAGASGATESSGDAGFDTQPIATHAVSPKPVERGRHARVDQGGARAKQGAAAAAGRAGAAGGSTRTDGYSHARQQASVQGAQTQTRRVDEMEEPPRRKRSVLSKVCIGVGVVLLAVAIGILVKAIIGYREAQSIYDDLGQYAVVETDGDEVPEIDFEALAAINSDIVGWIYVPGTQINYPVVQTTDNTTYLTKLFDDTSNTSGTIFMDYEDTAPGMVDQQTTIYGHHMNDGSMFKFIDNTLDQDDFDTVEVVYYITADATYVLKPLCTVEVDETYLEARQTDFGTTGMLQDYLTEMVEQASAVADDAEEQIDSAEQVLTLVTCAGEVLPRTTRACMLCTIVEIIEAE